MSAELLLVRVRGLGSMKNSPHILRFIFEGIDKGVGRVCLDLGETSSMDSTFMGMLLLINERVTDKGGAFHVINLSQENLRKLEELGITSFLDVSRRIEIPKMDLCDLDTSEDNVEERMRLVQTAHEGLTGINESNRELFGKIVEMLRNDSRSR